MVLELPTEVVDVLVSYVDDRHTLCSCSLTCRRWLPASRFQLFRNLSIPNRTSYDILVRLRDAPHISRSFANVYSLQLWEDQERPWLYLVPLIFARRLEHVRLLTLLRFRWHEFPLHPSFFTIGVSLTSITSLTLVGGTFYTFAEFRRLVCAFGHLTELIVERVAWRNPPMYSRCAYHAMLPRLQLLWLNSGCENTVTALVDWLLCTPSSGSVRDLQLGNYGTQSVDDMRAAQRLTAVLGAVLENYELSLQACDMVDLAHNTSLRTLHVRNVDLNSCEFLMLLLGRRVYPASLVHLSFDLYIAARESLGPLAASWAQVDKILTREAFSSLQMVTIWLRQVPPASPIGSLVDDVEGWMLALKSRCLLHVKPWWNLRN
ncbi:hypothetical protein L227DRAFT_509106 [Lentinus tigrinus ALCF2SS1-6]|uniref:F-box domain-containing protein n=1 Tax=Lentinus tigrinus ALCF2SS1-6 TaxID=1328759 RepID=A0A5C2RY12_9APHY|nr:hypothetical protein L227DRAFT_509106 [Lentinus tigrinus ALCF2SS1-6]